MPPRSGEAVYGIGKLTDLRDASHFHDRRLPLPFSKFCGLFLVGVCASKLLAITIVNCDEPMMVLPASIVCVRGWPAGFHEGIIRCVVKRSKVAPMTAKLTPDKRSYR